MGGYVEPHTGHDVLAGSRGGGPATTRGLSSQANASLLSHAGPASQRCEGRALLIIGGTWPRACVNARGPGHLLNSGATAREGGAGED